MRLLAPVALALGALTVSPVQALEMKPVPTEMEPVEKSLRELLNSGFEIVSGDVATSLILRGQSRDGVVYIACLVEIQSFSGGGPNSTCLRLN